MTANSPRIFAWASLPRFLLLLFACLLLAPPVWAHGTAQTHQLAGLRLCLEPGSVVVQIADDAGPNAQLTSAIRERLQRTLPETLRNGQVPFVSRASCAGEDAFVQAAVMAQPATEAPVPAEYAYWLFVMVGPHAVGPNGSPMVADGVEPYFVRTWADWYAAAWASRPLEELLPNFSEAIARDLAIAWWEDNPGGLPRSRDLTAPIVGGGVGAMVLAFGLLWRRRLVRAAATGGKKPRKQSRRRKSGSSRRA